MGCRAGNCGACEMRVIKGEARVLRGSGKEAQTAMSSGKAGVGAMIRACSFVPGSRILELDFCMGKKAGKCIVYVHYSNEICIGKSSNEASSLSYSTS